MYVYLSSCQGRLTSNSVLSCITVTCCEILVACLLICGTAILVRSLLFSPELFTFFCYQEHFGIFSFSAAESVHHPGRVFSCEEQLKAAGMD